MSKNEEVLKNIDVHLTQSDLCLISYYIVDTVDECKKSLSEIKRRDEMTQERKDIMLKLDHRYLHNKGWKHNMEKRLARVKRLAKKLGVIDYVEGIEKTL